MNTTNEIPPKSSDLAWHECQVVSRSFTRNDSTIAELVWGKSQDNKTHTCRPIEADCVLHGLAALAVATPPALLLPVVPLLPPLGLFFRSAPFLPPARIMPTSVWLFSCAHWSGVLPLPSRTVMSAPIIMLSAALMPRQNRIKSKSKAICVW